MRSVKMSAVLGMTLALGGLALAADWPRYRGPTNDGIAEVTASIDKLALKPVWKNPIGDSFGQLAVVKDRLYLMAERDADECAMALDAATGKEIWSTRIDKSIKDGNGNGPRSTPTIDGTKVYVQGTFFKIFCLDLVTGKEVWKHDLIAEYGGKTLQWGSAASPVIVDDLVLVTFERRRVEQHVRRFDSGCAFEQHDKACGVL